MPRYVIYGAGAIGGVIGARLQGAGLEVVLIARGAHLEAIAGSGLEVRHPGGVDHLKMQVVDHPEAAGIGKHDLVVLSMKSQDTAAALVALAECTAPEVPIVCAQNGLENERAALRRFANVYGCLVMMPAAHLSPGVVTYSTAPVPGVIDVGRIPSGRDETVERLADDLRIAGFSTEVRDDVLPWKRRKLLGNLNNAVGALFPDSENTTRIRERALEEGRACFAAAHLEVTPESNFDQRVAVFRAQPLDESLETGSSSWQSLARGTGSIETDYLNGEVVLLGRLHGIPTPVNAALQRLANEFAARHSSPGSCTVGQLEELLRA